MLTFHGRRNHRALKSIRNFLGILKELNHTFLVLIPKIDICTRFHNFRPIALCNTLYKFLTKTLATQLQKFLPLLISEEQSGFVQGRSIYDGMIIAQEIINTLKSSN